MKFNLLQKNTITMVVAILISTNVFASEVIHKEDLQSSHLQKISAPELEKSLVVLSKTKKFKVFSVPYKPKFKDLPKIFKTGILLYLDPKEEALKKFLIFSDIEHLAIENGALLTLEHYKAIGQSKTIKDVNIKNIENIDDRFMIALCENKNLESICLHRRKVDFHPLPTYGVSMPAHTLFCGNQRKSSPAVYGFVSAAKPICLTSECILNTRASLPKLTKLILENFEHRWYDSSYDYVPEPFLFLVLKIREKHINPTQKFSVVSYIPKQ